MTDPVNQRGYAAAYETDYAWVGDRLFSRRENAFVRNEPVEFDGPEQSEWVESIRARERARRENTK